LPALKLYYCDVLAPRKVCSFARHIGAPVEFIYVDLGKGEHKMPGYLTLNPNGRVPTLTHGAQILWEADAILCELAQRAAPDFLPAPDQQIEMIKWFSWNSQHFIRPGGELYFQFIIKERFRIGPPDASAVQEAQGDFRRAATVLNDHLKGRKWLLGDRPSVIDFSVGVTLPYEQAAHIPLGDFPEIRRWHEQLCDFPAWRDPWPSQAA
jgi:glutathione S-transferase